MRQVPSMVGLGGGDVYKQASGWMFSILLVLVAAVWGITWGTTSKAVNSNQAKFEAACAEQKKVDKDQEDRMVSIEKLLAAQVELNKSIDKRLENIERFQMRGGK